MIIQSLSVVVPNKKCINSCAFCVSRMHGEEYPNMLDENLPFYDLCLRDYRKRLAFARDNGCNTVMLTGTSEPQQNRAFLKMFGMMNESLDQPFRWVEMQTTGVRIDEPYLHFLRNHVGVNTISVSISSFDFAQNAAICGMQDLVDIKRLCGQIKEHSFTLRLSLNMSSAFEGIEPFDILAACGDLGADQVTFRKLYASGSHTAQDAWVKENAYLQWDELTEFVRENGTPLEALPFGATKYALFHMSLVLDDDCMSKEIKDSVKYLILRPDCKLYTRWDEKASLVF